MSDALAVPVQEQQKNKDHDWLAAWVLLLLLLGTKAARGIMPAQQRRARTLLRDKFNSDAVRLAAAITSGTVTIDVWQGQLTRASGDYARTMAVAGAGTLPSAAVQETVEASLAGQEPFLVGFANAIAEGALSVAAIAARSKLYGGVGWAAHWQAAESTRGDNVIVHYRARDDRLTCGPCLEAERNGPYRAGSNHVTPGTVCLGGGFCRCELEFETNAEVYASLR